MSQELVRVVKIGSKQKQSHEGFCEVDVEMKEFRIRAIEIWEYIIEADTLEEALSKHDDCDFNLGTREESAITIKEEINVEANRKEG